MFPVAHTIGTDFKRAVRPPPESITFFGRGGAPPDDPCTRPAAAAAARVGRVRPGPVEPSATRAADEARRAADLHVPVVGLTAAAYLADRRGTAAMLRALDAGAGGGFYRVPLAAESDAEAAEAAFAATGPVIDVQTHLIDPTRWQGDGAAALEGFLHMVDPARWPDPVDPAPRRRGLGRPRVRFE